MKIFKNSVAVNTLLLSALCLPHAAHATSTVDAPYVEQGEAAVEWQFDYLHDDDDDAVDDSWAQTLNAAYSPTDNIKLEIEGEFGEAGDSSETEFNAVTFAATWEFFTPGAYWLDSGLKVEYGRNVNGDADGLALKLLLAKDVGNFTNLANINVEREIGDDSGDDTSGDFAWSTSYNVNDSFAPGLEYYFGFDDVSDRGEFDDQGHVMGPVVYGAIGQHVGYEAGYLFGLSDNAPDGEAKLIINYTTQF